MRGLEREEEDLEDEVSYLSIYLNGLAHLYQEQAQQLKHQIDRAERVEQRIEFERVKTAMVEVALANMEQDYLRERERSEMFHKNLGMSSTRNVEGEKKKLNWRKKSPRKLIGTKGPRPRT
jgi:hypothetical protein